MILDYLLMYFWIITYVFVIWHGFKKKMSAIPSVAISFNLAWEINAFVRCVIKGAFNSAFYGYLAWMCLDIVIFVVYLFVCKISVLPKWISVVLFVVATVGLYFVFAYLKFGMLISVFMIDLGMAILWVIYAHSKALVLDWTLMVIGATKLLGDCFAFVGYMNDRWSIKIFGIAVLVLNVYCLMVFIYRYFKSFPRTK